MNDRIQGKPIGPLSTDVPADFDPATIRRIIEFLDNMSDYVYVREQNVEIVGEPDSGGRRTHLILRSPDGNRWQISVDNAGALQTTLLAPVSVMGPTGGL